MAKDTAVGGGSGLVMGGALGGAMAKANPYLERFAQGRAYKALDPYMNSINRDMAGQLPEEIKSEMLRLGKRALDENVIPTGAVDRFATSENLASTAAKLRDDVGVMKGAAVDVAQDQIGGQPISTLRLAQQMRAQAKELMKSKATLATGKRLMREADDMVTVAENRLADGGSHRMGLPEAELEKTKMQHEANYNIPLAQRGGAAEKAKKLAASTARQASEDAIDQGLGPEDLAQFKALKDRYGDLDKLADTAGYGAVRNFRNQYLSLGDKVAAGAAPETGNKLVDGPLKWAWMLANKVARERGSSAAARTARNMSQSASSLKPAAMAEPGLSEYARLLRGDDEESK